MNCGDCKHWGGPHDIGRDDGKKDCSKIGREEPAIVLILAYDWDGASLRTSPEFSCSLWEAK